MTWLIGFLGTIVLVLLFIMVVYFLATFFEFFLFLVIFITVVLLAWIVPIELGPLIIEVMEKLK